jgi:hypothetical protein
LLNYRDQDFTLDDLFEIRKQSALQESEEPEPGPKERTMAVLKLAEGLGLTEGGIKVFEDSSLKEQRTATRQEITGMFACYEETLKEKKRGLCFARLQCFISSSHLQERVRRHLYCWTLEMIHFFIRLRYKRKYRLLKL